MKACEGPMFKARALLRTAFLLAAMPAAVPDVAGCKVCNLRSSRIRNMRLPEQLLRKPSSLHMAKDRLSNRAALVLCTAQLWSQASSSFYLAPADDVSGQFQPLPRGWVCRRIQQSRRVQQAPAALRNELPQPARGASHELHQAP